MRTCSTSLVLRAALCSLSLLPSITALSYKTNEFLANVSYTCVAKATLPRPLLTIIHQFDDLTRNDSLTDIGIYRTMHWHNLFARQPSPNSEDPRHGGLYPKSTWGDGLQPATTMACHDTLTTSLFGAARLSTNYLGSQVALFDLQTFSFGCLVLDPETHHPLSIPKPCAVQVRGYTPGRSVDRGLQLLKKRNKDRLLPDLDGVKPHMEMTLWFTNPGDEEPTEETKMRLVRMESLDKTWWALGAVTFEAVADGPVMLCIDDVSFRTYNITKWGETFAPPEHEDGWSDLKR